MLSKSEEFRLASFLDITRADIERDIIYASDYKVKAVRWLAEKLKETNDELKKLQKDYEKLDVTLSKIYCTDELEELKADCEELKLKYDQLNGTA
jgi:hypothetical protein